DGRGHLGPCGERGRLDGAARRRPRRPRRVPLRRARPRDRPVRPAARVHRRGHGGDLQGRGRRLRDPHLAGRRRGRTARVAGRLPQLPGRGPHGGTVPRGHRRPARLAAPPTVLAALRRTPSVGHSATLASRCPLPAAAGSVGAMTEDLMPPTPLEASAMARGANTTRYGFDYLMLPMRDGVRLATIVVRPTADGRYPALLVRSPYPNTSLDGFGGLFKALFEKDYAVVLQNERGSEWSEGQFGFLAGTTADGQDTLDWIARQEWSNGRVGMHGCSSTAENQLKLAAIGHPALRACVPMSSGAGIGDIPGAEGGQGLFYRGGVPMLGTWALWHGPYGVRHRPKLPDVADDELNRIMRRYSTSVPNFRDADYAAALAKSLVEPPSGEVLRRMGSPLTGLEEFIASPTDPSWDSADLIDASQTGATPSINVNGWLDVGAYETVKLFEFQQHHPDQYLIMAPTGHCQMTRTAKDAKLGDRPVGDTTFDYDEIFTAWFDRWLRDEPDAWKPMPKVRVFLMGAGTWLTGETWPLPDTRERSLYLSSDAGALTLWGDGALRQEPGAA